MKDLTALLLLLLLPYLSRAQEFSERFELIKLGNNVNTHYHEAAPVISPDGNTLYFFVDGHPDNTYGKDGSQDIWVTDKGSDGEWGAARHSGSPFNQHRSNQVFTVFEDGTLFVRGGRSKNSKGFSMVLDGSLTELHVNDFDKMNKGRFYGASMSADKKHMILYFSESANSALSDLYVSHVQADGSWSTPAKLKLSHSLDDFAPFIGPDQKTLYYASGRPGEGRQGGIDVYKTTRLDNTWENWSEPVNLGKPVNTAAMDAYFSIDKNGNVFLSRANSRVDGGNLDIFVLVTKEIKINLAGLVLDQKTMQPVAADVELRIKERDPEIVKTNGEGKFQTRLPEVDSYTLAVKASGYLPKEQSFKIPSLVRDTAFNVEILLTPIAKKLVLNGNIVDQKTGELIPAARLEVSLSSDRKVNYKLAAGNGKYEREVPKLGWYVITASAEGYINATDSVWFNDEALSPMTKDIHLQRIEVGVTVRLKNIYFDFDKTTLQSESFTELNKVVDFLKQNSSVEIEIAGHTDSKGSDDYNLNLSQGRSQSVVDYLISQGIDSFRLNAHGYGETKPIDSNDTDEGRANNRRVEFTVVKK